MKVLVLAFGHPERAASTMFRIAQYADFLASRGVTLEFIERQDLGRHMLDRVAAADVVLNQKCVVSPRLGAAIRSRAKRLVFDFDDAMWTRPGRDFSWFVRWRTARRLRWWLSHVDAVVAANHYLANWARPYARSLKVLPMAVDLTLWKPLQQTRREEVIVGWAGSPAYVRLVERLEPALAAAMAIEPRLRLTIYCGQRPNLRIPFTHVPYQPGTEAAFVQTLDVGLLPMEDDAFGRGKSPIKSLQYLSCGVPVLGHFVGATKDILDDTTGVNVSTDAEWTNALVALARDPARRQNLATAGLARIRERHDRTLTANHLYEILVGK